MVVHCPECGKPLQVKADLPPGKRIRCPKCAVVFAPVEEVDDDPPRDPEEREEREERRPRRRRGRERDDRDDDDIDLRPRRRRRKARQGMSAGLLWGLIGGAAVLVLVAILVPVLIMASGNSAVRDQHEEAMKEALQIMTDLENAMRAVKDQESARTCAVKINQICDRMEALGTKVKALPKLTQADNKRLQDKYKSQLDGFAARMQQVGFQAGLNSRGELSFIAAAQRLTRVGQTLQQMGI